MVTSNLKTIWRIRDDGNMTRECVYDGKFAAIYALALYVAQQLLHVDYLNQHEMRKIRSDIRVGGTARVCHYEHGDSIYSCLCYPNQTVYDGEHGSSFDYEPNYQK